MTKQETSPIHVPIPEAKRDLDRFLAKLKNRDPFTFVRFSDGEMEILRGHQLKLGPDGVTWSKGKSDFVYPVFDHKDFDPTRDSNFQAALISSAKLENQQYFKGVPASHNKARDDRDFMIHMNGGTVQNLTFSDLLINGNFKRFRNEGLREILNFSSVAVVGNHRMQPSLISPHWRHISVPDNLIAEFPHCLDVTLQELATLPNETLVLSSASSLSNIIGAELLSIRPDVFFLDIGTALHDLMGMPSGIRSYQVQLLPWKASNFKERVGYYLGGSHRLRW